jgi:hypothetical protein
MSDRRIRNISNLPNSISVHVKSGEHKHDITTNLGPNEEMWCRNDEDTRSLLIYLHKRLLSASFETKPERAQYYTAYSVETQYDELPEEEVIEQPAVETVEIVEEEKFSIGEFKKKEKNTRIEKEESKDSKAWSKAETKFLTENYLSIGAANCAKKLNRTLDAVKKKAKTLNLTHDIH